ncbi:MAG: ROK family protein [Chthoniobacterales bacterium]
MKKKILVVDIGGTHVKLMLSRTQKRKFDSGSRMGPKALISAIKESLVDWKFDAVSIGFPAPVKDGRIAKDPKHLAKGWSGFNFSRALGKPVHVINDAAMQALGSYRGGRMLFLGLGTGLGSALVWSNTVLPLELGDLPYADGIIEDWLGKEGLETLGRKDWEREVRYAVAQLKLSFIANYVVLGGGNAKVLGKLPDGIMPGQNRNAYMGGVRLWQVDRLTKRKKWRIF